MTARTALVAAAAAVGIAAAALYWWWTTPGPTARLADRLAGERWYVLTFRDAPIGQYRASGGRTPEGDFAFRAEQRVRLAAGAETATTTRLVFHRRPPHPLTRAERTVVANGRTLGRVAVADGVAQVEESGRRRKLDAEHHLALADHLAVESWLAGGAPAAGDERHAKSWSFDRLAVLGTRWRALAGGGANGDQVALAKLDAPQGNRLVFDLDAGLAPVHADFGDGIAMRRVAGAHAAGAWRPHAPLLPRTAALVPVDPAIDRPQALRRLVVAMPSDGAEPALLLTAEADPRAPATPAEVAAASVGTLRFPATDPRLRNFAARAVADYANADEKANALTTFVHHFIRYRDTDGPRTVHDTLRDRRGDCTEFADLYTTLARAVGLPARTVVGLAYRRDAKAFALHAWNEVAVDAQWRGVDPTWGQTRLDATHLPLPADAPLAVIANLPNARLRVVEADY